MSKLSLFQKLMLANTVFCIFLFSLLALMINAKNEAIDFAEWEKKGDEYQRPLEALLQNLSIRKLVLQRALNGDQQSQNEIPSINQKIDTYFSVLEELNLKIGSDLQFTDQGLSSRKREHVKLSNIKSEWKDIKDKLINLTPIESNDKHTHLITDIRTMITHAGDTSNLILDPDLDSYYLMDATLVTFPQMQDRIQEITTYAEPLVHRSTLTDSERVQLAIYAALLKQSDLDRLQGDFQTAINEDKNFYDISPSLQTNLPKISKEMSESLEDLISTIARLSASEKTNINPTQFVGIANRALDTSFRLWSSSVDELDTLLKMRIDSRVSNKYRATLVSLVCLLLFIVFSFWLSRRITDALNQTITHLGSEAFQVRAAANNINEVSKNLSSSTTEQAAALQETAASIEEMNAMIQKSSQSTNRSKEVASRSHSIALQGKESVANMENAIQEIDRSNMAIMQQVEEGNRQITEIVKVITEIGNKTKVINDIVFQTKLLSFNASVEAARAGEHGKGFAVVAEEVGNLAQMSGNAAKEISEMLNSSIQKVEDIVNETKQRVENLISEGKAKVHAGTTIAKDCGKILEEVVNNVSEVKTMMSEIAVSSQEQSSGVSEITKAMNELDQVTHGNASTSQQAFSLAENLASQADNLIKMMNNLEVTVRGEKTLSPSESSPEAA